MATKKKLDLTDVDARTTPVGLFNFAETYWLSAKALKAAEVKGVTHRAYPVYFLYYHAIELYLKAYLRLHGHGVVELSSKKFGHDAGALSKRARELGLPVKPKERTLFFDVERIIQHHRPRVFLLENVRNLVNHDKGHTFKTIHDVLTKKLGYHVAWKVIDAKSWVPQHRERIFIVGFRDRADFSFDGMNIPDPMHGPKLGTILHPEDGTEAIDGIFTEGPKAKVSKRYTLSDHLWGYLQAYAEKHKQKGNGFGFGLFGPKDVARTLSAR